MSNRREREAAKIQAGRDAPHIGQQAIAHESLLAGKATAIRREAPPIAEDKQYGRETSSGQGISNNREIGHFRTASISQATLRRTETTELTDKSKLV
jgi:hypothetical protein